VGAEPEPSDPEIGTVIGERYRIVELLGTGGMGAVYRGEHLQLAKPVAIKLLRPEISTRKDSDQRFQREALAGARLQHPNVVGVLDFGHRGDGSLYLVMELLQGDSLRNVLDKTPRLPWQRALHIARQVLRGLAHAHEQGVIHRDIKPENIHLTHDGEDPDCAKLIDFGIAMLTAGEGADVRITAAGLAVGTPTYLSPEQAVGGKLGPPSDLYSLSVVLFEMLAGRPPFVADEPVRLLTAHAMTPPPSINELAPEAQVPAAVEAMVHRGLGKTWAERVTSATEYIALIDEARRAGGEGSNPTATPYLTPAPVAALGTPLPVEAPAPVTRMRPAWTQWRPTPRQLRIGGIAAGAALLVGILVAILGGDPSSGSGKSRPSIVVPAVVLSPGERENAFKAALLDLTNSKTCPERREAVLKLRDLGDARAIPALKKARRRMRGGILGIGDSNTNNCLKKDAEAAILALGGDLK
jgi:eukaryotic-like serine/threonine-protein kinase